MRVETRQAVYVGKIHEILPRIYVGFRKVQSLKHVSTLSLTVMLIHKRTRDQLVVMNMPNIGRKRATHVLPALLARGHAIPKRRYFFCTINCLARSHHVSAARTRCKVRAAHAFQWAQKFAHLVYDPNPSYQNDEARPFVAQSTTRGGPAI